MFGTNVGDMLKKIAKWNVWCWTVVGGLWGIAIAIASSFAESPILQILGIVLGPVLGSGIGFLIGWLSSVVLYAFGSLVSNTQQVNEKLERLKGIQCKVDQLSEDLNYLCDVKENEIKKAIRARQAVGTDE